MVQVPVLTLVFLRSVILSTLTFNVHVRVSCSKAFATINCVYMRVLRRIAGEMRFSSDGNATDLEVRIKLNQPSLDCLMLRARLLYFCRLLNSRHTFLIALLSSRSAAGAVIMPWTLQLRRDLILLFNAFPRLRAESNRIESPSLHVCGPP